MEIIHSPPNNQMHIIPIGGILELNFLLSLVLKYMWEVHPVKAIARVLLPYETNIFIRVSILVHN